MTSAIAAAFHHQRGRIVAARAADEGSIPERIGPRGWWSAFGGHGEERASKAEGFGKRFTIQTSEEERLCLTHVVSTSLLASAGPTV